MQPPATVVQLALLVLLVLPGITYQFVRERRRGPVPGERDLGERVLRAIVASIALDALYVVVAGRCWFAWRGAPAAAGTASWSGRGRSVSPP